RHRRASLKFRPWAARRAAPLLLCRGDLHTIRAANGRPPAARTDARHPHSNSDHRAGRGNSQMFESMPPLPPDAILGIMALFRADPHPGKIDLSVGVYQDDDGRTPVLESVRRAESAIVAEQDTKTYVAIAGNAAFNRGI